MDKKTSSTITQLNHLLEAYPELIKFSPKGELRYQRKALIKKLNEKKEQIIITSFERGLKRLGFEVKQPTRKGSEMNLKIWLPSASRQQVKLM